MDQELFQLIQQAKRGNQDAFSELVKRYKGQVFRHAYAMVNDRMEAEDIAQEAFVKAYFYLPKLGKEYAFVSWLTRIVTNLCHDSLKKLNKKKLVFQTDNEDTSQLSNPKSDMENTQLKLTINEALQTLSEEHRTALILRDMQGYSYSEIAGILNIPLGTVKSRINIARASLKKEMTRGDENA
ncbi:RNA polymerase sigma factor [Scopulibacillus cellulosilyticus]|uniref:RNA polymerase sigma factor n=1 Tax=Scopulibacillus cellulosilyticus TaxID=2665665 RepID=A0ABW2PRL3_9BACL